LPIYVIRPTIAMQYLIIEEYVSVFLSSLNFFLHYVYEEEIWKFDSYFLKHIQLLTAFATTKM